MVPLGSIIIAIADRFDRVVRKRPFDQALDEINRRTGKEFELYLVEPLIQVVTKMRERPFLRQDKL